MTMTSEPAEPAPDPATDPRLIIAGLLAKQVVATERIAKYIGWILALIVLSWIGAFIYGFAIGMQSASSHATY